MNTTGSETGTRALRPVARHFDKDGAPVVPLSPTRGLRNANTIYEKIKDLPEHTVIRADYDRGGKPFLYFPRTKKHSIQPSRDLLGAANEQADRQEALNIMLAIAQDVQDTNGVSQEARLAALRFGLQVRQRNLFGDLRVGDVRDALAKITGTARPVEAETDMRPRDKVLHAQLHNFTGMPVHLKQILAVALETGRTAGSPVSTGTLDAMFTLVQTFLDEQPRGGARAFLSHVGRYPLSADLIRFAWQWRKLAVSRHTTAGFLFRQMPWTKHIDFAARVIKFIAQRHDRWKEPGQGSEHSLRTSAWTSSASAGSASAFAGTTVTSIAEDGAKPPRNLRESQRGLVSLPKAEASSEVEVRSPPVRREESRMRPFPNPAMESSDLRVFSPPRDDADVAASSRSPVMPSPMDKRARPAFDSSGVESIDDESSVRSLLDNIEWIPLDGNKPDGAPTT